MGDEDRDLEQPKGYPVDIQEDIQEDQQDAKPALKVVPCDDPKAGVLKEADTNGPAVHDLVHRTKVVEPPKDTFSVSDAVVKKINNISDTIDQEKKAWASASYRLMAQKKQIEKALDETFAAYEEKMLQLENAIIGIREAVLPEEVDGNQYLFSHQDKAFISREFMQKRLERMHARPLSQ